MPTLWTLLVKRQIQQVAPCTVVVHQRPKSFKYTILMTLTMVIYTQQLKPPS